MKFQVRAAIPDGFGHQVTAKEFYHMDELVSYLKELASIEIDADFQQIVSVQVMIFKQEVKPE